MMTVLATWRDLLTTKKFWTAIIAVITLIAASKGFDVDPKTLWGIVGIFVTLLGAQGLTDMGKSAALINAATAAAAKTAATPPKPAKVVEFSDGPG